MNKVRGKLYVCATPIGNLEDITFRALRVLKEVDYIVAEDTRHTIKLLNHFKISKPLISYHEHNKKQKGKKIISLLEKGYNVALVSDAGMPGISDPGIELVNLAHKRGIQITVLPGPTACITALVLSGFCTARFVFEGFIPREKKKRLERMKSLKNEERTIIIYESPHRLLATLEQLLHELGNRRIAVVRELTKIHEEVLLFDLESAIRHFQVHSPKGEIVLVLEGCREERKPDYLDVPIVEHIRRYMEAGLTKKEAIKQVAKDRGLPKNEVYKYSIKIE